MYVYIFIYIYIYIYMYIYALVALQERLTRRLEEPCDHDRLVTFCQTTPFILRIAPHTVSHVDQSKFHFS